MYCLRTRPQSQQSSALVIRAYSDVFVLVFTRDLIDLAGVIPGWLTHGIAILRNWPQLTSAIAVLAAFTLTVLWLSLAAEAGAGEYSSLLTNCFRRATPQLFASLIQNPIGNRALADHLCDLQSLTVQYGDWWIVVVSHRPSGL